MQQVGCKWVEIPSNWDWCVLGYSPVTNYPAHRNIKDWLYSSPFFIHSSLLVWIYNDIHVYIYVHDTQWNIMKCMYISFTHLKYKRPCWHSSPNPTPFQFLGDVATCLAMGRASLFQLKVVPLMEGKTAPWTFVTWGSLCCGTGGKVEQPAGSIATKYHWIL